MFLVNILVMESQQFGQFFKDCKKFLFHQLLLRTTTSVQQIIIDLLDFNC